MTRAEEEGCMRFTSMFLGSALSMIGLTLATGFPGEITTAQR